MTEEACLRLLRASDDAALSLVIRNALIEHGANRSGFAWEDPELDELSRYYAQPNSSYWVVEERGEILGGAGIAPFPCDHPKTCEVQKMYLTPAARGKGWGRRLLQQCIDEAVQLGYELCYLETLDSMQTAGKLYRSFGFDPLPAPRGDSGHGGCDRWYLKKLAE